MIAAGSMELFGLRMERAMRRLILAAVFAGVGWSAQAADLADLPILRGAVSEGLSSTAVNWDGIYAGGHLSYTSHDFDFSKTAQSLQRNIVRDSILLPSVGEWTLLGSSNVRSPGFGGFVGYNWQWDDVIVGFEANYTHFQSKVTGSTGSLRRTVTNPDGSSPPAGHSYQYDLLLTGDASAKMNDMVTLRARAGWSSGIFLPYMFGGLAIATVDIARSATLTGTRYDVWDDTSTTPVTHHEDPSACCSARKSESQKNLLTFGFSAGFGTEMLLTRNIFARAEYEYTQLPLAKDTLIQLHTGRVGIGAKF